MSSDRFDTKAARAEMARIDGAWGHCADNGRAALMTLLRRALDAIDAGWPEATDAAEVCHIAARLGRTHEDWLARTDEMAEEAARRSWDEAQRWDLLCIGGAWNDQSDGSREDWHAVIHIALDCAASLRGVAAERPAGALARSESAEVKRLRAAMIKGWDIVALELKVPHAMLAAERPADVPARDEPSSGAPLAVAARDLLRAFAAYKGNIEGHARGRLGHGRAGSPRPAALRGDGVKHCDLAKLRRSAALHAAGYRLHTAEQLTDACDEIEALREVLRVALDEGDLEACGRRDDLRALLPPDEKGADDAE